MGYGTPQSIISLSFVFCFISSQGTSRGSKGAHYGWKRSANDGKWVTVGTEWAKKLRKPKGEKECRAGADCRNKGEGHWVAETHVEVVRFTAFGGSGIRETHLRVV